MQTIAHYSPGTVVLDHDGDALRVIEDRGSNLFVEYRDDRIIVRAVTIDHDARVHFQVFRDPSYADQGAPWMVRSDTLDPSGDHTWGHFPTHAEAVAFTDKVNAR